MLSGADMPSIIMIPWPVFGTRPTRVSPISTAVLLLLSMASVQAAGRQFLHGHVPEAVAASDALGPVPRSQTLSLAVGLPLRNQDELDDLLKQLVDPSSPNYRHY